MKISDHPFLKNSAILICGTILSGFISYLFHFLISRQLSVAEYGELQSLFSSSAILGVVSSALSYFIIKYSSVFAKAKDYQANRAFWKAINRRLPKYAFILLIIFFICSPLIKNFLHLSSYWGLWGIGASLYLAIITVIYTGILSGWEKFLSASIIGLTASLVKLFSGLLLSHASPTATVVSFSMLISCVVGFGLGYIFLKRIFGDKIKAVETVPWQEKYFSHIDIGKSIVPTFLFSLFIIATHNIDVILVKNLTCAETAGYYSAMSILGKIILCVNAAIIAVVMPRACASGMAGNAVNKRILFAAYGLMLASSAGAVIMYALFPTPIIKLLFDARYLLYARELWLFGIMASFMSFLTLEANLAYARHNFKVCYILAGTTVSLIIGLFLFHGTIFQIIMTILLVFLISYVVAVLFNKFKLPSIKSPRSDDSIQALWQN